MKYKLIGILVTIGVILTGCGNNNTDQDKSSSADSQQNSEVRTIQVAYNQNGAPYDFTNEKGEPDGYEIQVLKEIDKKLEDYQFEYTGTSDEDLLIGLETGKFDLGSKSAWKTPERLEKFLMPEEPYGASILGFVIRSEDKDKYKNIDELAKKKARLVPISPQYAQYKVIQDYNDAHPDNPLEITPSETLELTDAYAWVLENRYDAYVLTKLRFENAVLDEKGPYHKFKDKLAYVPYKGIPTYPIIKKSPENEKFIKAYDKALRELKEEGVIDKISQEYFGEDIFELVEE